METILIIEDNAFIRENLTEYFELERFKILAAPNGEQGIALAKKFKPNLIICDVLMPEMDGFKVLQLLKTTAETSSIPFIFSTSLSELTDRAEAINLGADDYIIKPFELDALLAMARYCITMPKKQRNIISSEA
jgi:DNA-binding response OmpR family regulator